MYRDNRYSWAESFNNEDRRHEFNDLISQIDGNYIVKQMMIKANRSNHFLQHRCWVVSLDTSLGRPSEIRSIKLNTMEFYSTLQRVVMQWVDMKNKEISAKPIIHNRCGWQFDWLHSIRCYWAVENGLYRSEREVANGCQYSLFPLLGMILSRSTPKKVQTAIQNALPDDTPAAVKKMYSGKSIKYAGITDLYGHPEITGAQAAQRHCHSIGNTGGDVYRRKKSPHNGIAALRARSGYENIKADDHLPDLIAIGKENEASLARFIDNLFVINIEAFLSGNSEQYSPGKSL